jgi:hypothetical protein
MMKRHLCFLVHSAAFSIALLLFSASAWADITGYVYNIPNNMNVAGPGDFSGGTFLGSFSAPSVNFDVPVAQGTSNPLSEFLSTAVSDATLSSSPFFNEVMSNCTNGQVDAGDGCYSTGVEITGSGTFVAGTQYSITHDDGVVMYVDGIASPVIDAGDPTSAEVSTWTPTSTVSGNYQIWYVGTNGNPEVLISNVPANAATPEPGAVTLLLTMLMAVAGFAGVLKKKLA